MKNGSIKAITRDDCRSEWLAVLHYPHLPIKDEERENIILAFDAVIALQANVQHEEVKVKLPVCSDKDDQKFLEIARDAKVDVLITKDKALLKLARKTKQAGLYQIETPDKFLLHHGQATIIKELTIEIVWTTM